MTQITTKASRRQTFSSSDRLSQSDLFAFSMHGNDPTSEYFDEILASPTPDDMYLDSFHGSDTMHNVLGTLPLLSLDDEEEAGAPAAGRKTLKRSKSKKKKRSKRLSSESQSSKKNTVTKSKSKPSRSSKSKKVKTTTEDKNVAAMLKKLEEYEESLHKEWLLLQKERESIALERETLQLKMCELESKLDELDDQDRSMAPKSYHNSNNDDEALRVENAILQRRLQRQDEIILQLSNTDEKAEHSKEVSRLEEDLRKAKDLNAKNEKIIKGQKLTIERLHQEQGASGNHDHTTATDKDTTFPLFQSPIVSTEKKYDDDDDGTASISTFTSFVGSTMEDSFSSLRVTKVKPDKGENKARSFGKIKSWVKTKSRPEREQFRNRIITPEEAALDAFFDSL